MARRIPKISNPQVGVYSVRYRDSKGRFTKSLSKANSFQYVLKNGDLSRKLPIPKEIKKVADRNTFIKLTLSKIYTATIKRTEKANTRKKEKARAEGKTFKPEEIIGVEEALDLSKQEREQIERQGVSIKRPDYNYRVNTQSLQQRRREAKRSLLGEIRSKKTTVHEFPPIIASTEGSSTPTGKDGKYLTQKKKGKEQVVDWYRHQLSTGLITENNQDASIMYNVIRNVKKFFQSEEFKKYKRIALKEFPRLKYVNVRLRAITDMEDHQDFLTDDEDEFTFSFDMRSSARKIADSASWHTAKGILGLINRDWKDSDERFGGLTSNEIHTKIKLPLDNQDKKVVQEFILIPYMTLEVTYQPKKKVV